MELNILQIILESGIVVKSVLVLLIISSVMSWAVIFYKRKTLKKIEKSDGEFYKKFIDSKSLDEVNSEISEYQNSGLAVMFQKGYLEFSKIKNSLEKSEQSKDIVNYMNEVGIDSLERSLKNGANIANLVLEKRLATLASIGSVTPFIGLFGTVWGIIDSFTGLASGGGSIEAVAPGIAEALVATAVGLFAAIPAVWLYNIFTTRVGRINSQMDSFAQDFLNTVQRSILKTGN